MDISLRGKASHIVIMLITIAMELNIKDSFGFIIIFSSASPHIARSQQVTMLSILYALSATYVETMH